MMLSNDPKTQRTCGVFCDVGITVFLCNDFLLEGSPWHEFVRATYALGNVTITDVQACYQTRLILLKQGDHFLIWVVH